MGSRGRNYGLRKICSCHRNRWPKCSHPWHFSYKPRGGPRYRFSLDVEIGHRIEGKIEADKIATDIRSAINAGTYRRAAERRAEQAIASITGGVSTGVTLKSFNSTYNHRVSKAN